MSTLEAENAAWSGAVGEDWQQTWVRTSGSATYSGTLLVTLHDGDGNLVATSAASPPSGVAAISTAGTNVAAAAFKWAIVAAYTTDIVPGEYRLRWWCSRDGQFRCILDHDWQVTS